MKKNKKIWFAIILLIISILFVKYLKKSYHENFENLKEDLGNYFCGYFAGFIKATLDREDYIPIYISPEPILNELPKKIPFNEELYNQLMEKNITHRVFEESSLDPVRKYDVNLWRCTKDDVINAWTIFKPTIHKMLDDIFKKHNLINTRSETIIHFRCSDVPFIKMGCYHLQRYKFFTDALTNSPTKDIIIKSVTSHYSDENKETACKKYVNNIKNYLEKNGYNCKIEAKTNIEDFADIFYAPYKVSTSGSFSFMSGFFGDGTFVSTEQCPNIKSSSSMFLRGYNVPHELVEDYLDVDSVHQLLLK